MLLEEDQAEKKSQRKLRSQTDTLSFSDGSLQLNAKLPFLYGGHSIVEHSNSSEDAVETSTCMWITLLRWLFPCSSHRSQHQPGALLSGPEAHHDVSAQPYN